MDSSKESGMLERPTHDCVVSTPELKFKCGNECLYGPTCTDVARNKAIEAYDAWLKSEGSNLIYDAIHKWNDTAHGCEDCELCIEGETQLVTAIIAKLTGGQMKGRLERQLPNEASMKQDLMFVMLMRWAEREGLNWMEIMLCGVEQGFLE